MTANRPIARLCFQLLERIECQCRQQATLAALGQFDQTISDPDVRLACDLLSQLSLDELGDSLSSRFCEIKHRLDWLEVSGGAEAIEGTANTIADFVQSVIELLSTITNEPPALLADDAKEYDANSLPAAYREGGKVDGVPLVIPYLTESTDWQLTSGTVAGARRNGKVRSVRIRIDGKLKEAHDYESLAAYRLNKTRREDGAS